MELRYTYIHTHGFAPTWMTHTMRPKTWNTPPLRIFFKKRKKKERAAKKSHPKTSGLKTFFYMTKSINFFFYIADHKINPLSYGFIVMHPRV